MTDTAHDAAVSLVRAYYAAFNRGDWDGMLALLAPVAVPETGRGEAAGRRTPTVGPGGRHAAVPAAIDAARPGTPRRSPRARTPAG